MRTWGWGVLLCALWCSVACGQPATTTTVDRVDRVVAAHGGSLLLRTESSGFSPRVTRQIWAELPESSRACSRQILGAQLTSLAAESADALHSFRNCHIDEGRAWIRDRLGAFRRAVDGNRPDDAARALGESLAGVQAFYTYTNYVELLAERSPDWDAATVARVRVWADGPLGVETARLQAHYSSTSTPSTGCVGAPDLDKSTARGAGAVELHAWGMTAHEAAVRLAEADMSALLAEVARERPGYADRCERRLLFGVLSLDWLDR